MRSLRNIFCVFFVALSMTFFVTDICAAKKLSQRDKVLLAQVCNLRLDDNNAKFHLCIDRLEYEGRLAEILQAEKNPEYYLARDRAQYHRDMARNGINTYTMPFQGLFGFGNAEGHLAHDAWVYHREAARNGINTTRNR